MDIQEQVIALVHMINTGQLVLLSELSATIIHNSLFLCEKTTTYLSILYQLIFHTYKSNPTAACHILNGFIQFGQSTNGAVYKPMVDYFIVEAYTGLFKIGGWAVLKPCVSVLRASNPNYLNDALFKHILAQIVRQLKQDENDRPYSSNLCYNLPREKSFSWGWFSYDLARAYFNTTTEVPNAKQLRKYMMLYRKLLTGLRKNALDNVVFHPETHRKIEENWPEFLIALREYTWASDIIKNTINDDDTAEPTASEPTASEPTASEPVSVADTLIETLITVAETLIGEPVETTSEPVPVPDPVPDPVPVIAEPVKEKNTSWLSWFGLG
jgi:hypothetical protein